MTTKSKAHPSHHMTDHRQIRKWVEERGGKPATIKGTPKKGEEAGLLRIDFPTGASNPPLKPISWDDFFQKFDEEKLALIYQEDSNDKPNYFCKFVARENV